MVLRLVWQRIFGQAWLLNSLLFLLLGALRAYGSLGAGNADRFTLLGFLLMGFLPLIFLNRVGRRAIGLKSVERPLWLIWGALMGGAGALVIFLLGVALYGNSAEHWFVSVRTAYQIDPQLAQSPTLIVVLLYTIPAMIFSPIGEEIFFRGMIHEAVNSFGGQARATVVNAVAFGGIHLFHHGLTHDATGLHFLGESAILWVGLMMGMSGLFTLARHCGGAIWPAVVSHAAFNLVMNLTIFYLL
jgi:membrane protease YdiL (CAAX protease family)